MPLANRFHSRSDFSPLSLARVQIARTSRVESFEEQRPRSRAGMTAEKPSFRAASPELTWTRSLLGWKGARSRRANREKRPLCLHR